MRRFWIWGIAASFAIGGTSAVSASRASRLPVPEHVTSETQAELHARMARHGETMTNLIRSVVLLDRPTIEALAIRIADEEIIARANKAAQERRRLNLPPEFFTEQTVLSGAARALAAAAEESDDVTLAERFGDLTGTCIRCHSVYLHGRPEPQPFGPKTK